MNGRAAFAILLIAFGAGCQRQASVSKVDQPKWPEFTARVNDYVVVHKRAESGLPALNEKSSAEELIAHQKALADAIRTSRAGAQPGDIFTADAQPKFRELIRTELKGTSGQEVYKTIMEDNPKSAPIPPVSLEVNAPYPDKAPLSTVPPTLLLRLPRLPKDLEYRFVGRDLILRDATADVIVDYMRDVLRPS